MPPRFPLLLFLLQSCGKKPVEGVSHASRVSRPDVRYLPAFDSRKRRIRGLWQRGSSSVARVTTKTPDGPKKLVGHVPDAARSVAEPKQASGR